MSFGKKYVKMKSKIEHQILVINEDTESASEYFNKKFDLLSVQIARVENMVRDLDKLRFGERNNAVDEAKHDEENKKTCEVKAGIEPVEDSISIHNVDEFAFNLLYKQRESLKRIANEKRLNPKRKKKLSKQIDEEKRRLVMVLTDYEDLKTLSGKQYKQLRRKVEVDIGELKELIGTVCQQINENPKDYIQTLLHIEQKIRIEDRGKELQDFDMDVRKEMCKIENELVELAKLTGPTSLAKIQAIDEEMKELQEYFKRRCQLFELDPGSAPEELLRLERSLNVIHLNVQKTAREKEREEKEKMMKKKCNRPDCDNKGLHRCKRCKTVAYCCQDCLTLHWIYHKTTCDEAVRRKEEKKREKEVD